MNIKINKKIVTATLVALSAALIALLFICFFAGKRESGIAQQDTTVAEAVGDAERVNLLLLGQDRASGLTDVMMLVSVDTEKKRADILQIPRDTYARYSERSYKKLNGAVAILGGADKLCAFLSETMGVNIDGYFLFTLDAFVKMVDAVGGVEIDLPFDMDYNDPYQNLSIHLDAGRQTLDGAAAEQFVRYRSGYLRGDLGRMDAQKLFMAAFVKKVTESMTPTSAVRTVKALSGEVETDLGLGRLTELVLVALEIKAENISMLTLAGEDIRIGSGGAWYYALSKSAAVKAIREHTGADISEEEFDVDMLFCDPTRPEMVRIYDSEADYHLSNASEINQNGIEIPKG